MNETNGSNETVATNEAPAPDPLQGARVVEVIEVMCNRGEGTDRDPVRRVPRYFSKRGDLLAENDGWHERRRMSEALLKIADLEARGDALVESLRARNRELDAQTKKLEQEIKTQTGAAAYYARALEDMRQTLTRREREIRSLRGLPKRRAGR